MASPSKQPSQTQKKGGGGWGSLLSGAVAGLESRLDTILADDGAEPPKSSRPGTATGGGSLAPPRASTGERSHSREARGNDRLAERLAKATAARSAVPSRTATPANGAESARQSGEESRSLDLVRSVPDIAGPAHTADEEEGASATDGHDKATGDGTVPSLDEVWLSGDSSRPSLEVTSSRPSADLPNGTITAPSLTRGPSSFEADLTTTAPAEHQQDLDTYMGKIDALQARLSYLANETVAAAKAANAESSPGSAEKQLAEKDERIALLMQEGEKLSKTELKYLQTIKKLRAQGSEAEKAAAEGKKKYEKGEARLRKAEQEARTTAEERKRLEKQVEESRTERANAAELVKTLTTQLKEVKGRAEKAEREMREKGANEIDKNRIAALENDVEDARIEKKLAEDRAASEVKKVREEFEAQKQRSGVRELELKNEISGLEARLEAVRSRAEESAGHGSTGESGVQLLRQVETLQRQHEQAKANWDAIEGSLNVRVAALERERDEAGRREAEARKRFRDVGGKARRAEEELEVKVEAVRGLEQDAKRRTELVEELQRRLEEREGVAEDMRGEVERQKSVWEAETLRRIEEERLRWQQQTLRTQSSAMTNPRKSDATRRPGPGNRLTSHDLAALHTSQSPSRLSSSRGSAIPTTAGRTQAFVNHSSSEASPPAMSRQESTTPTAADNIPPTPSIEIHKRNHHNAPSETFPDSPADTPTIADLVSTSAGPSVQLVERMSLLVRRLESEKAGFKDEILRLSSQRDSARDEVVALMREVEAKRAVEEEVREAREVRGRYEAALEMLGEREEEAEDLRGDVRELKRLYRELVEGKMGGRG
ncbi:hypothetical protein LTR37_003836 [Vermiconidia calcicola]|uniref:Uncharacterized protein n=1 Tax=Vermiconidia calcicola TaxID=1690605 RepID=A0ACC3NQL0_9PEZI|nr:hypothetical protein LTR37_003836 [Vermiconidia calcicola]